MKAAALSVLAGTLAFALWIFVIWLASANLFAEGPDTPAARFLASPIESWSAFVNPLLNSNALLRSDLLGALVGVMVVFGPFVAAASLFAFPLVRRLLERRRS